MINTIPTIESNESKLFGQITKKKNPSDYWLPIEQKPDVVDIKKSVSNKIENIEIITPNEAVETDDVNTIGRSIAGATILTAATIFLLLKGGVKGLSKMFRKARNFFDKRVQQDKLEKVGEVTLMSKMNIAMVKGIDQILKNVEAVNNFTTFKDLFFKKMMFNPVTGRYTGRIHDDITRWFEKIGRQAVVNSYKSTSGVVNNANNVATNLSSRALRRSQASIVETINGVSMTRAQWLAEADRINRELTATYNRHFTSDALRSRYVTLKRMADGLKEKCSGLRIFVSKDLFTDFIAEKAILKEKRAVQDLVKSHRRELSYSFTDVVNDTDDIILQLTQGISFKDADKINILKSIKSNVNKYALQDVKDPKLKEYILESVDYFVDSVNTSVSRGTMPKEHADELIAGISKIKNSIANYRQGKVEDVLDIYRRVLPEKEYKSIEKAYKNAIESIDESINVETEDFVSKLRDLVLGSAPTDILTVLGSIGVLGYHLGKSKDNEQRTSIALKYGIPALAGIGVSLYCNAKLFAGTKSLMIGTLSSIALNQIGNIADMLLQDYRKNKNLKSQAKLAEEQAQPSPSPVLENPPKTV